MGNDNKQNITEKKYKNIAFIGMMGSGKTTIAAELCQKLSGFLLVDADSVIEDEQKMKISNIFQTQGENYFRKLETEKIKQICENSAQIIALGGGAFENEENRVILLQNCIVIYLKTSSAEIYKRIASETHRPLLARELTQEKIFSIIEKRRKNYEKAPLVIDTDGKTPYDIVKEILGVLND